MGKKISLGAAVAVAGITAAVTVSLTYVYAMNSFNEKVADVNERQAMYTSSVRSTKRRGRTTSVRLTKRS